MIRVLPRELPGGFPSRCGEPQCRHAEGLQVDIPIWSNLLHGFEVVSSLQNLSFLFVGVVLPAGGGAYPRRTVLRATAAAGGLSAGGVLGAAPQCQASCMLAG